MTLKCLIVDDESLARKLLEENIRQLPFLELVGMCKNPFEAMAVLQEQPVDLMFRHSNAGDVGDKISTKFARKTDGYFRYGLRKLCRRKL